MTTFDPDNQPQTAGERSTRLINILTLIILISVVCVICLVLTIYNNPYSFFNPFQPAAPIPTLVMPTDDPTIVALLQPTETPTITPTATLTNSPPPPTWTPIPTETYFTIVTPSLTPTITKPPGGYPYEVQDGKTFAIASNIYHPEAGCKWMGIAGRVVDMSDAPVTGLIVNLGGTLPGITLPKPMLSLTGAALDYGPSGYEFQLAEAPIASKDSLWVQLLDQSALPLSDKVYFDTYASCDKNLILINFKQVR